MNGSEETNPTTGVNVTNMNVANNLVKKIEELLGGTSKHYICCDKTTQHEKIVIEYNYTKK